MTGEQALVAAITAVISLVSVAAGHRMRISADAALEDRKQRQ